MVIETKRLSGAFIVSSILTLTSPDKCEDRREDDFYPTPWDATEALMIVEEAFLLGYEDVDEPACGDGAMAEVIRGHGKRVHASDLIYRGYGIGEQDFLKQDAKKNSQALITNPPFIHAEDFIRLAHARGYQYIAMLLKANYFHAQKRIPLFREFRPVRVHPVGWRVDFTGGGSNHFDCIWVVWVPAEQGHTEYCQPLERPEFLSQPKLF